MSSGVVTNYNTQTTRRVEWIVGVDYGEDYDKVQQIVTDILAADKRILKDPAPFIALHALDASSVNVVARVWVNSADYWGVYFDINKAIYATFNEKGINFPFPQLTVHQKLIILRYMQKRESFTSVRLSRFIDEKLSGVIGKGISFILCRNLRPVRICLLSSPAHG